jgi:hypothetical protein
MDCAFEPTPRCPAAFECDHGSFCDPDAPHADFHGCARRACERDADCPAGVCVERACYDALGVCEMLPA